MRSSSFIISPEVEKIIAKTVASQMLKNSGEVQTEMANHFDQGWVVVEGECLHPEFLWLNTKDVCSIIEGRVLALLKSFYYCHEFVVIAHFHVLQQLGLVQIQIHMDAFI